MFRSIVRALSNSGFRRAAPAILLFRRLKGAQIRRILADDNNSFKYLNSAPVRVAALFGLFGKSSDKEPETKASNASLEDDIKRADQFFDNGQFEECYEVLKLVDPTVPDVEVLWRRSRALYQMACAPGLEQKRKTVLAGEAFETISEAMRLNDNHFAIHKWMAVVLDLKSSCDGTKERVKNLERVKEHMMRAIEINPGDATTLYMLGEWCYRIADMPWYQRKIASAVFATPPTSSYEEALAYFQRAETVEPNFYSANLLMLGKSYLRLGNEDAAKHYLLLALTYPARTNDDHQANKEAQELLKRLK